MDSIECLIAAIALGAVGWLLLTVGRHRGRVVDDHPLCRRCGYDLTGKPDSSFRCPECGASLAAKGAILPGRRGRNLDMIASGGLFLAIASVLAVFNAPQAILPNAWLPYAPAWIVFDLSAEGILRYKAQTELMRRSVAGSLPPDQMARFFCSQFSYELGIHPRSPKGTPILLVVRPLCGYLGDAQGMTVTAVSLDVDGIRCDPSPFVSGGGQDQFERLFTEAPRPIPLTETDLNRLGVGSHTVHVTARLDCKLTSRTLGSTSYTFYQSQSISVTVISPGDPIILLNKSQAMAPAIDSALSARLSVVSKERIDLILNAHPSIPVIAKVFLRVGKHEWPLHDIRDGSDYLFATNPAWFDGVSTGCNAIRPQDFTAGVADVILRPDPEAAGKMLDVGQIWAEDIVIPNVPIGPAPSHP